MAKHTMMRTSPKGQDFVGSCTLCGKRGLTFADANEECPNVRGLSQTEALLEVLDKVHERPGNG